MLAVGASIGSQVRVFVGQPPWNFTNINITKMWYIKFISDETFLSCCLYIHDGYSPMLISSIYVPERDLNLLGYPFESKVSSDEKKKKQLDLTRHAGGCSTGSGRLFHHCNWIRATNKSNVTMTFVSKKVSNNAVSLTSLMSTIKLCDITALFGFLWETNILQNLMRISP